jgi:hypothetical protein
LNYKFDWGFSTASTTKLSGNATLAWLLRMQKTWQLDFVRVQRLVYFLLGAVRDNVGPISPLGLSMYQLDAAPAQATTETANKREAVNRCFVH